MSNFHREIRRHLAESELAGITVPKLARQLNISDTTLRRRLREEGYNFESLLVEERKIRCRQILRDRPQLPAKCIFEELGYFEQNSFYRAFKAWFGCTFSDYKKDPGMVFSLATTSKGIVQ